MGYRKYAIEYKKENLIWKTGAQKGLLKGMKMQ
jgi:hypothetical protein